MYKHIPEDEQMKTLETLFIRDEKSQMFVKKLTEADYFEMMKGADLTEETPREIKISFDVARNIFIYSFFSFRMNMVAQTHAFAVLEYALRYKLEMHPDLVDKGKEIEKMSLSELFQKAIDHKWINDSIFPEDNRWRSNDLESTERCTFLKNHWAPSTNHRKLNGFSGLRNDLVHNPIRLDILWNIANNINEIACIIRSLFPPKAAS